MTTFYVKIGGTFFWNFEFVITHTMWLSDTWSQFKTFTPQNAHVCFVYALVGGEVATLISEKFRACLHGEEIALENWPSAQRTLLSPLLSWQTSQVQLMHELSDRSLHELKHLYFFLTPKCRWKHKNRKSRANSKIVLCPVILKCKNLEKFYSFGSIRNRVIWVSSQKKVCRKARWQDFEPPGHPPQASEVTTFCSRSSTFGKSIHQSLIEIHAILLNFFNMVCLKRIPC